MKKLSLLLCIFSIPGSSLATTIRDPGSASDFSVFVVRAIQYLLGFAAALAVLFIIVSGLRYITSVGNRETLKSAKATLIWAIVGLVVIVFSYVILSVVTTSVDIF